ncbi:hypothetical protein GPK34_00335 [Secundilactobacillus kimchicus]|uniref:hypothetical protein n=1 Tax=Secundilactobacillus kimchicus TaxID=528209 RepID=UPI001C01EB15|nr:hypothetical protein [Secundilactobacillus kimchicus]MBT9670484.1 hypothetical protein [Secundilactobacillus kimchicus]
MENTLTKYIAHKQYDLNSVLIVAGLTTEDLNTYNDMPVSEYPVHIIQSLAIGLHSTPGDVLNELLAFGNNPILDFMDEHPGMDPKLYKWAEKVFADATKYHVDLSNITFNRFENETHESIEDANQAVRHALQTLSDIIVDARTYESF